MDAVAWSPDGTRLASAGLDNTVRISDPRTGEETFVLRGNSGMFHDVSWHPDGAQLAAASSDGQIWIWDATRGFERDTTPRALPYIDRQVASGTARGEDLRWYAESYIRAGRFKEALAFVKNDQDLLRSFLVKLPADEQKEVFAQLKAEAAKTTEPAKIAERIELAQIAPDLEKWQTLWADVDTHLKRTPTPNAMQTKLNLDNRDVLDSAYRDAHTLARSQSSEAEPLFRQLLERYRKIQGPDGPLTLELAGDLAHLLDQTGRGAEAEPLFRVARRGGPHGIRARRPSHGRDSGLLWEEPHPAREMVRGRARPAREHGHWREDPQPGQSRGP